MDDLLRYGVISDTHGLVPRRVFDVLQGVRTLYHCGDIGSLDCVSELEAIAPLRLVSGNMDQARIAAKYPDQLVEDVEFGALVMAHGGHYGHKNEAIIQGLLNQFLAAAPRLILFGHSHTPYIGTHNNGVLLVNPGSASRPRIGHPRTVAIVEYDAARDTLAAKLVALK